MGVKAKRRKTNKRRTQPMLHKPGTHYPHVT